MIVEYDHPKSKDEELELFEGDIVCVLERTSDDWFYVTVDGENCGFVASTFLAPYIDEPPEHLAGIYMLSGTSDEEEQSGQRSPGGTVSNPIMRKDRGNLAGSSSSKISNKIREGTKFLKRTRRKSTGFVRGAGNITIKRQDTSPALFQKPYQNLKPVKEEENPVSPRTQRSKIAKEILTTERHYVNVMNTLVNEYQRTLFYGLDHYGGSITKTDIERIFINADAILPLNRRLLDELENVLSTWSDECVVGEIFERIAPFFKIYTEYGRLYDEAMATLARCSKNEFFNDLVEGVDSSTKLTARLEGLLISPIQRIPRYTLLLEELFKNTPPGHVDRGHLENAIKLMEAVSESINQAVKQAQDQSKLIRAPAVQSLLKPNRKLVHEGFLTDSKNKKIHLTLFNDIMVHLPENKMRKTGNFHKTKHQWPLHLVWVGEVSQKYKNAFTLIGPNSLYVLSSEDFQVWMMRILAAVTQYLESLPKSNDPALQAESQAQMSINDPKRYGTYEFPSSQRYTGWWSNGKFDGIGTSEFLGNTYEGSWRCHNRAGQGRMTYLNGDVYNGEWENDKQEGYGVLTYSNGDTYKGHWKGGKKYGQGVLSCQNGISYDGEWFSDLPHGHGVMKYVDGAEYNGSWERGMRNGKGIHIYQNGDQYEGEWTNDVKNGRGKLTYSNGRLYEGNWKDNLFHGQGSLISSEGVYNGEWVNGIKEGNGTMRYQSGIEYKGSWKKGMYHGNGVIVYKTGMIRSYNGDWQNNKKQGSGILQLFNDDVYDGHFKENGMHGSGTYTWKNGVSLKGKWSKGSLSNSECILSIPSKPPAPKRQLHGTYSDGRLISTSNPPIYIPPIPVLDSLE